MRRQVKMRYCSRLIDFPQTLYLGFIWITDHNGVDLLIPGSRLFQSTEKTLVYLEELQYSYQIIGHLSDKDILIIPLSLKKDVQLTRSHWTNGNIEKELYQKLGEYVHVIREHTDSQILVVSQGIDKTDSEKYSHAGAMSIDTDTKRLDKIIASSNTYVDPTSKNAALYYLDTPLAIFPTDNQIRITNFRQKSSSIALN